MVQPSSPDSQSRRIVFRAVIVALGFAGTALLALFGTVVGALPGPSTPVWWFHLSTSHATSLVFFYLGVGLLGAAWIALGLLISRGIAGLTDCWAAFVGWGLPLVVGPPIFSRDLYSYVAQGLIAKGGSNPYTTSPAILVHSPVYLGIASVWRDTPAPYGPLSALVSNVSVRLGGSSLSREIIAMRAGSILGLVLLMIALPRLATRLGASPQRALWLGVLSPLSLISFLGSGHNDGLMLGLMVCGILLIVAERLLAGFALGAAAATVKLPALGALAFPVLQRVERKEKSAGVVVALAVSVTVGVFVLLTLVSTYGFRWLAPSALSIPTSLRTLITPSVALGVFLASALHGLGIDVATRTVVTITRDLVSLLMIGAVCWLLWNLRHYEWVRLLGVALLVVAVGSPTLWPWYFTWGLCLLAATTAQRSIGLALLASLPVLLVGAQGTPSLTGHSYLFTVPLLVAGLAVLSRKNRWRFLLGTRVG